MSPTHNKSLSNYQEQEGRIELAIDDLKNQKIHSVRRAAEIYDISRSTLQNRLNGMPNRSSVRPKGHKLTEFEEESLIKWILDRDKRGFPPRPSLV
jgi:hypothetical protein